jgi:hypothetical protein
MGRPLGSPPPSPEARKALAVLKRNIQKRLDVLGISASIVGMRTGRGYSWLHDVLKSERYSKKISVNLVAEIGKALGVSVHSLLHPRYDGAGDVPRWYVDVPTLTPKQDSAP